MAKVTLAAFVVERNREVSTLDIVCNGNLRAPLIECLYDFRRLGSSTSGFVSAT
jgi:hypothetical protein